MTTTYAGHAGCATAPSSNPRPSANDITLIALHTTIGLSGLFARFTAHRWGFRYLSHAAERVAVELIARAVETARNPDPNPRYPGLGELHIIGIRLSQGNCLLIEVWDSDPTPPQDAYLDNYLSLVAEISHQWSYYRPRSGREVIRAELHRPEQRQVGEQLPHRTAGSYPYPETLADELRKVGR